MNKLILLTKSLKSETNRRLLLNSILYDLSYFKNWFYYQTERLDCAVDRILNIVYAYALSAGRKIYNWIRKQLNKIWVYATETLTIGELLLFLTTLSLMGMVFILMISYGEVYDKYTILENELSQKDAALSEAVSELKITYLEMDALETELERIESENSKLAKKLEAREAAAKRKKELIEASTYWTSSELAGGGAKELIRIAAIDYGVDPKLAIAISRLETGNWTSTLCTKYNNFGGIRNASGWVHYDTRIEGINAFCHLLKWYADNGMGTIETMAYTYCPDGTSNWIREVTNLYNEN